MKNIFVLIVLTALSTACNEKKAPSTLPLMGTWELISATSTANGVTTATFNPKTKMIKVINPTHFAFFNHDLSQGKDSTTATFTAGGGTYTFKDSVYTEHLEYFIDRVWENNTFEFVVKIKNDTLVQQGLEKVEGTGVDHVIVEKYIRVKR